MAAKTRYQLAVDAILDLNLEELGDLKELLEEYMKYEGYMMEGE